MSSDNELRCNNLKCRAQLSLEGKAVVTGCSHIFCVPCANDLFVASQNCPACDQLLSDPDDIVLSSLNPSNEYKAVRVSAIHKMELTIVKSILSGLAPSIILEVAVRAISFYQYQNSQESAFQKLITKSAQEKLAITQRQLDSAESELQLARGKISALEQELAYVNQKKSALVEEVRVKDQDLVKLRAVCDRLKRKAVLGPTQIVNEAVEEEVHSRQHQGLSSSGQRGFVRPHPPNIQQTQQTFNGYAPQAFYDVQQHTQRPRHPPAKRTHLHNLSGEYARSASSGHSPKVSNVIMAPEKGMHRGFYAAPPGAQRNFGM